MTAAPSVQVFTPDIPKAGRITLAAFALFVIGWLIYIEFTGGLDFNVYRFGAMTIFDNDGMHKDLYARNLLEYGDFRLPFTYPPFAALVFLPFAFLPAWVGIAIMYAISIGVAWWLATLIYNYAADRGYSIPFQERLGTYGIIAALTFIIIMTGPWRRGFSLIQINPIILTLVLADFIRPATRIPRGVLIGIAGGIKLTPLAFGLILLMRKDWRGIFTLGASFGTTILLGFIFLPQQAATFWTSAVSDSGRVGGINFADNISIQGWLMHLGLREPTLKPVYYTLVLATIGLCAVLLRQLIRRNLVLSQVAVGGFLMVSISPISWSHHNVMFPLIIMTLVLDAFPLFFCAPARLVIRDRTCFDVGGVYRSIYFAYVAGCRHRWRIQQPQPSCAVCLVAFDRADPVSLCGHGSLGRFGAHPGRAHSAESRSLGHSRTQTRASGRVAAGSAMYR